MASAPHGFSGLLPFFVDLEGTGQTRTRFVTAPSSDSGETPLPPSILNAPPKGLEGAPGGERAFQRDRLLASFTLMAGLGLLLGLPFALRAGQEFFLPVTVAFVVAIALVPVLQALERRGLPSSLAALMCVTGFIVVINVALAAIIVPASLWVQELPQQMPRIQANLEPLLQLYASLEQFLDKSMAAIQSQSASADVQRAATSVPRSMIQFVATSAPHVLIQAVFTLLLIYFLLAGWSDLRRRAIVNRSSFSGAMATARVIQNVVEATSAYLGTITLINLLLGLAIALIAWILGMPSPLMWGGIVMLCNYIPYIGPIIAALTLLLGGLMTFSSIQLALLPALIMIGLHTIEANAVTPLILGRRLTINPVSILISISFWGWIWGATGALLAIPLLIILQTVIAAAGKPDIAGFLFEEGTLTGPAGPGRGAE